MRARARIYLLAVLSTAVALAVPASASAYFVHIVAPGETLTSIAAADGLTVAQLALANGVSTQAELISGQPLQIPPQDAGDESAATSESATSGTEPSAPTTSASTGGYVVALGDTLSAIAANDGTTVAALAALNGLDPDGVLLAGTTLQLPAAGSTTVYASTPTSSASSTDTTAESQPVGASSEYGTSDGGPYPTEQTVSASDVADIASGNGVPPALADAIGWQESGFNNDEVSNTGAVGVMQIEPGTWDWIQSTLAGDTLAPASAQDNVRGGVLLLHSLLDATGGSDTMAAASYYQGLSSVQQYGMFSDTQQYVNDVMSLEQQYGGG
ncbi:MAG: LysM peptidoglycan-binding domain-containing protein [Solirubrobacteraceae bacterium]